MIVIAGDPLCRRPSGPGRDDERLCVESGKRNYSRCLRIGLSQRDQSIGGPDGAPRSPSTSTARQRRVIRRILPVKGLLIVGEDLDRRLADLRRQLPASCEKGAPRAWSSPLAIEVATLLKAGLGIASDGKAKILGRTSGRHCSAGRCG